jgi:hypothetical protein
MATEIKDAMALRVQRRREQARAAAEGAGAVPPVGGEDTKRKFTHVKPPGASLKVVTAAV